VVIKLDGKKVKTVKLRKRSTSRQISRPLAPGRHTVRVVFKPSDKTKYTSSKSRVVRITERRG